MIFWKEFAKVKLKFMELDEIKNLIEKDKGRLIIVENGKPELAVLKFEDYKKILDKSNNLGEIKKDQDNEQLPEGLKNEPLKIEDLPC